MSAIFSKEMFSEECYTNTDVVSVAEYIKEFSDWVDNNDVLSKNTFKNNISSEGTFTSSVWIMYSDINQSYRIFDFNNLRTCTFKKKMTKDDINLIKCWLVDKIRDDYSTDSVSEMFNSIRKILTITDNFSAKAFKSKDGNVLSELKKPDSLGVKSYSHVCDYIEFLDSIDMATEFHTQVLLEMQSMYRVRHGASRKLPSSKNIIAFEYYLNRFFSKENNVNLLNLYKPILLWWKITNVIPMRPSEFAYKLKRDCIYSKDGEYFLKISRVKVKNKPSKVGRIPILSKIKITKDIYQMIDEYIQATEFDSDSKTLISYNATVHFRKKYLEEEGTISNPVGLRSQPENKGLRDTYSLTCFNSLLDSFYTVIIERYYGDKTITERINPGDTRHLAFSSLALQGVTPIEIAMLGGHTTLQTQDSYSGHIEYYIDSEILDYVGRQNIPQSITDKNLIDIVFSKGVVCPRALELCSRTDDGVGYCTLDYLNGADTCDNVELCIKCSKWWCEPSNENYIKAKKFLVSSSVAPLQKTIENEEEFLLKLMNEAKTINVNGLLELDSTDSEMIAKTQMKLRSDVNKMIELKKMLLEYSDKGVTEEVLLNGETEK